MIDPHPHSHHSDGLQSVAELVAQAKVAGIATFSLTDHDTIAGLAEARELATQAGLSFIPGIELTTTKNAKTLHILAHGIDPDNSQLAELLDHLREERKKGAVKKLERTNEKFKAAGKPEVDIKDVLALNKPLGTGVIIEYLVAHNFAQTNEEAYSYIEGMSIRPDVSTEEVIQVVHVAGGRATLAHPLAPKISLRNLTADSTELRALCAELKTAGLDGLEVYTPAHTETDIDLASEIAQELNLFVTIGSDWHGPLSAKGTSIRKYIPRYAKNYSNSFAEIPEKAVNACHSAFSSITST